MQLSDCLFINHLGILLYRGERDVLHEVLGGRKGDLHLRLYQ